MLRGEGGTEAERGRVEERGLRALCQFVGESEADCTFSTACSLRAKWSEADFADAQMMAQCRTELAALQALIDEGRDHLRTLRATITQTEAELKLNEAKVSNTNADIADKLKAVDVLKNNVKILETERARFHEQYLQRLADAKR